MIVVTKAAMAGADRTNITNKQVGVKAGERILQLSFGSGFKCAANYWRALRDVRQLHAAWERGGLAV